MAQRSRNESVGARALGKERERMDGDETLEKQEETPAIHKWAPF